MNLAHPLPPAGTIGARVDALLTLPLELAGMRQSSCCTMHECARPEKTDGQSREFEAHAGKLFRAGAADAARRRRRRAHAHPLGRRRSGPRRASAPRRRASCAPMRNGSPATRIIRATISSGPSRRPAATTRSWCCATSASSRIASTTWRRSSAACISAICRATAWSGFPSWRGWSTSMRGGCRSRRR